MRASSGSSYFDLLGGWLNRHWFWIELSVLVLAAIFVVAVIGICVYFGMERDPLEKRLKALPNLEFNEEEVLEDFWVWLDSAENLEESGLISLEDLQDFSMQLLTALDWRLKGQISPRVLSARQKVIDLQNAKH